MKQHRGLSEVEGRLGFLGDGEEEQRRGRLGQSGRYAENAIWSEGEESCRRLGFLALIDVFING